MPQKPEEEVAWLARGLQWKSGEVYYGISNGAGGALNALVKSAAASADVDDKADDNDGNESNPGLVCRDCGEVFLLGECVQLKLLIYENELPFPCKRLRFAPDVDSPGEVWEVAIRLPGATSHHPPGAYVLACHLDKAEQEHIYNILCHESCEGFEDVYRRMLKQVPRRGHGKEPAARAGTQSNECYQSRSTP